MSNSKTKKLTKQDYDGLLKMIEEPLTDFDCGSLCAPANDGIPFCCDVANAVPLLYKTERKLIDSRSDIWKLWEPKTKDEKELADDIPDDMVFCECKGVQFCERENRSISCRTFPLEPYFDTRCALVGLVYNGEFLGKCPLTKKKSLVPQRTIDSHYDFWDHFTDIKPDEVDCYYENSKTLRRKRGQTKKAFVILYPTHLKKDKNIRKYV